MVIGRKGRAAAAGLLCFALWAVLVLVMLEVVGRVLGNSADTVLLAVAMSLSIVIIPAMASLVSGVVHAFISANFPKPSPANRLAEALLFALSFTAATFLFKIAASGQGGQIAQSDLIASGGTAFYSMFFFIIGSYFAEGAAARRKDDAQGAQ
jgi:hypothetical protein